MAVKKYTIVILPDGTRKIRQIKIPRLLVFFLSIVFIASCGVLGWGFSDYKQIKTEIPELAQKKHENEQLKAQLASLVQKYDRVNGQMAEYKKLDDKLRIMVNLETDESGSQFIGIGGSNPALLDPEYTVEKAHKKLIKLMHRSLDNLETEISMQIEQKSELYEFLDERKSMLACTPSIRPTKGWISSRFGQRVSPFTNQKEFHNGLDISARMGTPILAPADGIVESAGTNYGFGKILTVNHGYGFKTVYAHLSKFLVKKGEKVKRGQEIAQMGNTGRSTGTHLHYEVHLNGVPVNPLQYILN